MKSLTSRRLLSVLALAGATFTSSCAFGPGDYKVYSLAMSEPVMSADCNPNLDPAELAEKNTVLASGTYYLFAGPDDVFYLDTGLAVFEGSKTDDGYSFAGETVEIEVLAGQTHTQETTTSITVSVDGKAVSGMAVIQSNWSCMGDMCPGSTSCTSTTAFVGAEVKDVDIEHQI